MIKGIEFGMIGAAVRMSPEDAPKIRARAGEIVFGTHMIYDSRGAISPIMSSSTETFRPEKTNWGNVLEMVAGNPNIDIEVTKRTSVMKKI